MGTKSRSRWGVHGHDGPGVAGATAPGQAFAFGSRGNGIRGKRIPAPAESAAAGIIGAHHAASHVHAMIVINGRADNHEVVDDRGRGSHVVPAGFVLEHVTEAHLAGFAEVAAGSAGGGIYCDEAGVLRSLKDATPAGLVCGAGWVEPSGDAAIDEAVAIIAIEIDFRVIGPALLAGFGVERDDAVKGGSQIESSVVSKPLCFLGPPPSETSPA
ncbi:MAG TPA: hypothetical protein VF748_00375 [Candidatus Acidoferrum sp.]